MPKIKLITTYLDGKPGDIIDEDDEKAKQLVELGRAEYVANKAMMPSRRRKKYETK